MTLLLDLGFSTDQPPAVLEGWGPVEPAHRWTVGNQSRIRLPVTGADTDCVVVLDARPWCDPQALPGQTVMLSLDDRLLATIRLGDHRAVAFAWPAGASGEQPVLGLAHLNAGTQRPLAGLDRQGRPLGLLVSGLRVFRVPPPALATRPALPGALADGSLQRAVLHATGLSPERLMLRFESIGENCEFGLVQRGFGADPLGLLRFASVVTHKLVDGLMAGFAGVGAPEATRIYLSDPPESEYKVHEQLYYLWYSTGRKQAETTPEAVRTDQCRKFAFLQRGFAEDLRSGAKIYVLSRGENLTEPEALAVYCALRRHGENTLLWTVHGDTSCAGAVDRLRPGFLRGHLGAVDQQTYARWDAWLSVLANAVVLAR